MATSAARTLPAARRVATARVYVPLGLGALAAVSVLLRVGVIDAGLWIDEGLSVGIADRPLRDIPGVLRQDGSPPLYYMLLHIWMKIVGTRTEEALHTLSLIFAVLTVPVAYALARRLVSARAAWIAAVLFATNPFLTRYAQEARMYALVVLLSLLTCAAFAAAFALRPGRRWTVGFAIAQATLLYTHNWGLFLGAGLAAGFGALLVLADDRRGLLREGLWAAAIIAVLYAPWVPTLLFQTAHTGAPWARTPGLDALIEAPGDLLGFTGQYLLLLGVGAGAAAMWADRRRSAEGRVALALALAGTLTLVLPWLMSAVSPAFALRYTAVAVGPLLLLAALGLARAGRLGVAVLVLVAALWAAKEPPPVKSNVREVARGVAPSLAPGDLVIATQPEQIPVLNYYLSGIDGLDFATLTGPLTELGVTDWRDGAERLAATSPAAGLEPLLDASAPGRRIVLITPFTDNIDRWKAPWTRLVRIRGAAWTEHLRTDPRFRVVSRQPISPEQRAHEVGATVFVRQGGR